MPISNSVIDGLLKYVKEKYNVDIVHPWPKYPSISVMRHKDNEKIFVFFSKERASHSAGMDDETLDIISIKTADPLVIDFLINEEGFSRSKFFGKGRWLTIDMDGTVPLENIIPLVDDSFMVTASAKTKQKYRGPKEWVVPSNLQYYDSTKAFDGTDTIMWKQGRNIKEGDIVYLYAGHPVSAILYKCLVAETDIPCFEKFENVKIPALMRIKLLRRYPHDAFTFERLKNDYGVGAIRGPRGIPEILSEDLNRG